MRGPEYCGGGGGGGPPDLKLRRQSVPLPTPQRTDETRTVWNGGGGGGSCVYGAFAWPRDRSGFTPGRRFSSEFKLRARTGMLGYGRHMLQLLHRPESQRLWLTRHSALADDESLSVYHLSVTVS